MQWGDSFSPKLLCSNQSYLDEEYSYSTMTVTVTRAKPLLKSTLFSVCKIQEGRAESIKSAQQLAMMASRMISVRTLQHPAGTDGWSTWSAEAPSAWAAEHNDCLEISAASKGSSILPRHSTWVCQAGADCNVTAARYAPKRKIYTYEKWRSVPGGRSYLQHTILLGNHDDGYVGFLAGGF